MKLGLRMSRRIEVIHTQTKQYCSNIGETQAIIHVCIEEYEAPLVLQGPTIARLDHTATFTLLPPFLSRPLSADRILSTEPPMK